MSELDIDREIQIVIAMDIDDFLTSMQVDELRKRVWRGPLPRMRRVPR